MFANFFPEICKQNRNFLQEFLLQVANFFPEICKQNRNFLQEFLLKIEKFFAQGKKQEGSKDKKLNNYKIKK